MMEIDRISYIFGSFARRRQSHQDVSSAKKRPIEAAVAHDRSRSTPHTPKKTATILPRAKSICNTAATSNESKFRCPECQELFVNPKVLPCFHTFCEKCLQEMVSDSSADDNATEKDLASSGYVSDSCTSPIKKLTCPTCGAEAEVPSGGAAFFPHNYILQHRMVLAAMNSDATHLLCDVCPSETTATSRCMECAISMCDNCKTLHLKERSRHEVLALDRARKKGITRVRRQVMCLLHPEVDVSLFCNTCCQVICRECASTSHKNHRCDEIAHSIKAHLTTLRHAAQKAKSIAEQSALAANRLHTTAKAVESHCAQMQQQVEKFIENYMTSIQTHRCHLLEQIEATRAEKLNEIGRHKNDLHRTVRGARDVAFFLDELLGEGSDVEVMSFVKPVLAKVEECGGVAGSGEDASLASGNLQFLPNEVAAWEEGVCPVYGVITSQAASPAHCLLLSEAGLTNLRVGKRTEVLLETRDYNNQKLERGGEQISAEIRYRDAGVSRFSHVDVEDRRDGTYLVSFAPDVVGKLILSITIKGQPIKGNPFPIIVRSLKPHHGTFHCCSFCSSGGSKEASCGCGGKMPGGYKGCGHGHEGHPGRRHWSCCGNILEHSECNRLNSNSHYQFTL